MQTLTTRRKILKSKIICRFDERANLQDILITGLLGNNSLNLAAQVRENNISAQGSIGNLPVNISILKQKDRIIKGHIGKKIINIKIIKPEPNNSNEPLKTLYGTVGRLKLILHNQSKILAPQGNKNYYSGFLGKDKIKINFTDSGSLGASKKLYTGLVNKNESLLTFNMVSSQSWILSCNQLENLILPILTSL